MQKSAIKTIKMLRTTVLIVIGLILSFSLEAKKVDGKLVLENEAIDVIFNIPVKFFTGEPIYERLQYKVKYFDSEGKRKILRADDAKEIQFTIGHENVRMLSRYNSLGIGGIFPANNNIFLRLVIDGKLRLFKYYYTQIPSDMDKTSAGTDFDDVEKCVLQKGDGELKKPKVSTFKKDMADYLSDCPELVEKIQNKDFRKADIESIVEFYNTSCK